VWTEALGAGATEALGVTVKVGETENSDDIATANFAINGYSSLDFTPQVSSIYITFENNNENWSDPNNPEQPIGIDNVRLYSGDAAVANEGIKDYFVTTTPRQSIRAITIADYTIVTNEAITVAKVAAAATPRETIGLVNVKNGVASQIYKIYIDGAEVANYATGDTSQYTTYQTHAIAAALAADLSVSLGVGWTILQEGSAILIIKDDNTSFTMKATDTWGEAALVGIVGKTQKFSDLPAKVPSFSSITYDLVIEISGDVENNFDNYYVRWEADSTGENRNGVWKECPIPNLSNTFDANTMPHQIIRSGANEFTVSPVAWEAREVGDEISAPDPSFVGATISGVFFYKNRLGFLTGESVVFSRGGSEYFNFWPSTALDVLDDDPIDISVASTEVSILRAAIPASQCLMLFGDQQQFILTTGDSLLTPKTAKVESATHYLMDLSVEPALVGANIYFVVPTGQHSKVMEYGVLVDGYSNNAVPITSHAPTYIPSGPLAIVGSDAADFLCVPMPSTGEMYVYRYYWNGSEKIQSAWGRWSYDGDILCALTLNSTLYLVVREAGGEVSLERIYVGEVGEWQQS
jgi:hypothetical protein